MGSYSGMAHLTDLFKNKCIYTDEVFYNSIIANENCIVLPKKIKIKNKTLPYNHKNITNFLILIEINIFKKYVIYQCFRARCSKSFKNCFKKKKFLPRTKKINISFDFINKNFI